MDTVKIKTFPVILSIVFVAIIEYLARYLHLSPLLTTATARLTDITVILLLFYFFSNDIDSLGLSRKTALHGMKQGMVWSFFFGVAAICLAIGLFFLKVNPIKLLHMPLPKNVVAFYIVGGVIGPVAEEIFFRGVIYGYLRNKLFLRYGKWGIFIALVFSTALFVIAHSQAGIPICQLIGGIVFCISYEVEKSLLTPMIIHSLGNIALFTISFL